MTALIRVLKILSVSPGYLGIKWIAHCAVIPQFTFTSQVFCTRRFLTKIHAMRRISLLQLLLVAHYLAPGIKTIEGFLVRNGRIVAHGYLEQRPQFSRFDTPAAPSDVPANEPQLLQPFLPAADPKWSCRGPVGEGTFVIRREGGPTREELCNENIIQIVRLECSDLEVNTLVWKCLGYRFEEDEWTTAECFPNWREKHPTPPDFIGMQRM